MTVVSDFSVVFENNRIGVITGTFASSQFPNIESRLARFRARSTNAGSVFVTTVANGLFGWEIDAGNDTGWIAVDNLNNFWQSRSSGSSDYLDYWVQW